MATSNQINQSIRLTGTTVEFGPMATRDFSRGQTIKELKEIVEDIASTDLDREFSFDSFLNNEAVFFFMRVEGNPVTLKYNNPAGEVFTVPAGGAVMMSCAGVEKVYVSGQPAGDSRIFIMAAGAAS